jgi:phosphoglycerate kinase
MLADLPRLEDLGSCASKRVLLRADLNVPITTDQAGERQVADDFRIRAVLPTIEWLQSRGAIVDVRAHLGRPKGLVDPAFDMEPVRRRLAELAPGALLGENLRFSPGEVANDPDFVRSLVAGHDLYVDDAFGAAHRAHGSIVGPPELLPSAAGRLVVKEVTALSRLLEDPPRPFVAVIGGAKVADKLGLCNALADRVDALLIGGGMAFTFLAALGYEVGDSLLDRERVAQCRALLQDKTSIVLPSDVWCCSPSGSDPEQVELVGRSIAPGWRGLDVGPATVEEFSGVIASARSLLWNGPMGVFEDERFSSGTLGVARAVASCAGYTVVGGGDSVAALRRCGLEAAVDHVSSGGGATLELVEHGDLPGLAALRAALERQRSLPPPSRPGGGRAG